ncbi:MAG: hypothetical protein U0S12_08255 [Fimbriimonadales bacterium]
MSQNVQDEGFVGRMVGNLIRRSVKKHFRTVYWTPPAQPVQAPAVLFANHHGWFDGYLLYHAVTRLGVRCVDWIQEFDAFPLFAKVGGMPYRLNDPSGRAATIRRTIRLMQREAKPGPVPGRSAPLPPDDSAVWRRTFELLAKSVPNASFVPVAIRYEHAMHERPEAFLRFGPPIARGDQLSARSKDALQQLLDGVVSDVRERPETFEVLVQGTPSINERWDWRKFRR